MARMTATRTHYTSKEVQDLLDDERTGWFLLMLIVAVMFTVMGAATGIWFATNLYGG
jgi:fluoride ion exporter CrcB/FEX